MGSVQRPRARWDFFICHAWEDKDEVARPIHQMLAGRGHSVWLDETELTIGDSLRQCIDRGLANCRFGIVVLSAAFFQKNWTQYELDGLMGRQLSEGTKVVLPVWHEVGHDDIAAHSPALAGRIAATTTWGIGPVVEQIERAFVAATTTDFAAVKPAEHAKQQGGLKRRPVQFPLNDQDRAQMVAERSDFWEYFLFADAMTRGSLQHEAAWRDHQLRLVRPTGGALAKDDVLIYIRQTCQDLRGLIGNVDRLLAPPVMERAFGRPGEHGNPEAIEHICERLTSVYGQWLEWAADVRSTRRPKAFDHLLDLVAAMPDRPLQQFREFVERTTVEIGAAPGRIAYASAGDLPITIELKLVLSIDEDLDREYHSELRRLTRRWKRL